MSHKISQAHLRYILSIALPDEDIPLSVILHESIAPTPEDIEWARRLVSGHADTPKPVIRPLLPDPDQPPPPVDDDEILGAGPYSDLDL
jgi:hypothetical protein